MGKKKRKDPKENPVGRRIAGARNERGLRQEDVVLKLQKRGIKMSVSTFSRLENNDRLINARILRIIVEILDLNLGELFK